MNEFQEYLEQLFGPNAKFKEGQLEAIEAAINIHATLVVEKTGWGKSLVYFLATKYFRLRNAGPSIIVSPLLALMRNQQESARKLGLNVVLINYQTLSANGNKPEIIRQIASDSVDIIFTTPEQLAKDSTRDLIYKNIKKSIELFVIDEAHCISSWGHDFRLSYTMLKSFIQSLNDVSNLHILATTATANNYVIYDLKEQFGNNLNVIRGELIRESLEIQIINCPNRIDRFAWVLENVRKMDGSGIIYCLTKKECDFLADWLNCNGITSVAYYSDVESESRPVIEERFNNNQIKVVVATSALGMGYDKPDVAFVIHFQMPGSILEYYQQIGRAGRDLKKAKAILLVGGKEDKRILDFFRNNAFPDPENMVRVLNYLEQSDEEENKYSDIASALNLKLKEVKQICSHLNALGAISAQAYKCTMLAVKADLSTYQHNMQEINDRKLLELNRMMDYCNYDGCYMQYICNELNDPHIRKCNHCFNCTGVGLDTKVQDQELIKKANEFLTYSYKHNPELQEIKPRKQWAYPNHANISTYGQNNTGYFLSFYDIGLGNLVSQGKYVDKEFSETLVSNMSEMLKYFLNKGMVEKFDVVTYVPSLRHPNLVKNFAQKVASRLKLPCEDLLIKLDGSYEQKSLNTSELQCENALNSFVVNKSKLELMRGRNILIIDDMVDSKWTLTICGYKLLSNGAASVTPAALASSAQG